MLSLKEVLFMKEAGYLFTLCLKEACYTSIWRMWYLWKRLALIYTIFEGGAIFERGWLLIYAIFGGGWLLIYAIFDEGSLLTYAIFEKAGYSFYAIFEGSWLYMYMYLLSLQCKHSSTDYWLQPCYSVFSNRKKIAYCDMVYQFDIDVDFQFFMQSQTHQ